MKKFLKVSEVAEETGWSEPRVLAMIRAKQLEAINVAVDPTGRPRWRVSGAALEAFLRERASRHLPNDLPDVLRGVAVLADGSEQ